jgi:hypothetical protein
MYVYRVNIDWSAGPLLTTTGKSVRDQWRFAEPLTCATLATFLEQRAAALIAAKRKLAWNLTGQVKNLAALLRASDPDYLAEPWPDHAEADTLLIDHGKLTNYFAFKLAGEPLVVNLQVKRWPLSILVPF